MAGGKMGQGHKSSPCQQNSKFYYDKVRIAGWDYRKLKTNTGKSVPFCSTTSYFLVLVTQSYVMLRKIYFEIITEVLVLGSPDTERVYVCFDFLTSVRPSICLCLPVWAYVNTTSA